MPEIFKRTMYRGDTTTLTFIVEGDHTARKLAFIAKKGKDLVNPRIITKKNTLDSGGDDQLLATLIEVTTPDKTKLEVFILPVNTNALTIPKLYFDITSTDADDSEDVETVATGVIVLVEDVSSYYDDGSSTNYRRWGTTAQRPTLPSTEVGFEYFDTDLGSPIWWDGDSWV